MDSANKALGLATMTLHPGSGIRGLKGCSRSHKEMLSWEELKWVQSAEEALEEEVRRERRRRLLETELQKIGGNSVDTGKGMVPLVTL